MTTKRTSLLDKRDWIAGLEKGLAILEAFDDKHARMTATDAGVRTGLSRTAARRYLLTLEHLGYVYTDGKLYGLTPRVLRVGWSYFDSARLPRLVQPYLQLAPLTPYTLTHKTRLRETIRQARADGFAVVEQQLQIGVRGIALPLKNRQGEVVAALSTNMPMGKETTEAALQRVLPYLQEAALGMMNVV